MANGFEFWQKAKITTKGKKNSVSFTHHQHEPVAACSRLKFLAIVIILVIKDQLSRSQRKRTFSETTNLSSI
jgi:hypothetical protein